MDGSKRSFRKKKKKKGFKQPRTDQDIDESFTLPANLDMEKLRKALAENSSEMQMPKQIRRSRRQSMAAISEVPQRWQFESNVEYQLAMKKIVASKQQEAGEMSNKTATAEFYDSSKTGRFIESLKAKYDPLNMADDSNEFYTPKNLLMVCAAECFINFPPYLDHLSLYILTPTLYEKNSVKV
jgi:hypothetical protein